MAQDPLQPSSFDIASYNTFMEPLSIFFSALWHISREAAPYLCLGFSIGALLHRYVKPEWMVRFLGTGRLRPIVTAAAFGVPLPLCSCSVVPTALALKNKGASRGATLAFLISTPETGVDSILLTYGLLGPVLAMTRPLAALCSAVFAGILIECFPPKQPRELGETTHTPPKPCCSSVPLELPQKDSCCSAQAAPSSQPLTAVWYRGLIRSFFALFDDIAVWLVIGLLASALMSAVLPEDLLSGPLGAGWMGMVLALVVGLPMSVCATASTPLALVFMEKGLSMGAALVFLLVGPATNIGTVGIVSKMFGKRGMAAYLLAIASIALLFGAAINQWGPVTAVDSPGATHSHVMEGGGGATLAAAGLWVLLAWRVARKIQKSQLTMLFSRSAA